MDVLIAATVTSYLLVVAPVALSYAPLCRLGSAAHTASAASGSGSGPRSVGAPLTFELYCGLT